VFWQLGRVGKILLRFKSRETIHHDLVGNKFSLLHVVEILAVQLLISSLGGTVSQQFSSVPAVAATMPVSQISTLTNNSLDRPVAGLLDLSDAASTAASVEPSWVPPL
jgi:hypothetical protein